MPDFHYQRVVIILPERLGDSLFHTPAIRLLKTWRPDIHIGVIALSPLCAEVIANNPHVAAVYVLPSKSETQRIASRYDVTLLLHTHTLARKYAQWLNLKTIPIAHCTTPKHWSQHSLDFTAALLGYAHADIDARYTLFPAVADEQRIAAMLRERAARADEILIGCHIGCHSIAKRGVRFWRPLTHPKVWPLEYFVELGAELRKLDARFRLVLTGSKSERSLGERFVKAMPNAINLIDRTSVLELAALMRKLDLFVTGDTGVMHVACASEVGLIALFGPTELTVTGPHPRHPRQRVIQASQLTDIDVAQVVAAVIAHPAIASRLHNGEAA